MDKVRERLKELRMINRKKVIIGIILLIIIVAGACLVEHWLSSNPVPEDITVYKSEILDGQAEYIEVEALDTNIIAVKVEDIGGFKYSFAFDDCEGCYQLYGKHFSYKVDNDNTGIICPNCEHTVAFEEMDYVAEECRPVFIDINDPDIIQTDDSFVFTAEYLEKRKIELEDKRAGKAMTNTEQ